MSTRRRLAAVARLLDAQRRPQEDAQRRERERLDAMTDDELARNVAALERALELLREWSPDFAAELDAVEL